MKKNINKTPTIDSIHLGSVSFPSLVQENLQDTPFEMLFYFGNKSQDYIGQYEATPGKFDISEESAARLKELILSLENDMATTLFGESETVEAVEEGEKLPPEIRQALEYPAEDTFNL